MKQKTIFAFQRILDASQELKKVVDKAPDARKEVKEVASYLFEEKDWSDVQKRFEALTKRSAIPKTSDKNNDNTQDRVDGQPTGELDNDETVGPPPVSNGAFCAQIIQLISPNSR